MFYILLTFYTYNITDGDDVTFDKRNNKILLIYMVIRDDVKFFSFFEI